MGGPLVGLMCEVDEANEKLLQMGLCGWRYGRPNARRGSVLSICLHNLVVRERGFILYGKT